MALTIRDTADPGGRICMEQKLVVHKKDGRIYKGVTQDFDPHREAFHFLPAEGGGIPIRMELAEMKALFWVRDYIGNRQYVARHSFDTSDRPGERTPRTTTSVSSWSGRR
jgi:hypothetical protein